MKAIISLPIGSLDATASSPVQLHAPAEQAQPRLPRVVHTARKGAVLYPSPIGDSSEVLSLNLARGCVHRCTFCSVRASPSYPGDAAVYLFTDTCERLAAELAVRPRRPRAVYVSPSTDPFPPLAEFQAATARVVETLAGHGVEAWLMTRGYIRPGTLEVLAAHRDRVKVTVGMTTLDRTLQRVLEPLAAPPRLRLRQIARLRSLGIPVQVAVEPLVPGLTDTRATLAPLLEALADAGVRHITTGYMFLRPGIRDHMLGALEAHGWDEMVLDAFTDGPVLAAGNITAARYLPKARRQRGYAGLMALAAGLGMTVSVCGLTNPDFRPPRGRDTGARLRQRVLSFF
jgi:DNA repair photolyase